MKKKPAVCWAVVDNRNKVCCMDFKKKNAAADFRYHQRCYSRPPYRLAKMVEVLK